MRVQGTGMQWRVSKNERDARPEDPPGTRMVASINSLQKPIGAPSPPKTSLSPLAFNGFTAKVGNVGIG
jgi:hypothetical protein